MGLFPVNAGRRYNDALGRMALPHTEGTFAGTQRFQVQRLIGRGATGEVYEALDRQHQTRVALKLLTALSPRALLRFKNDFRSLRDIDHPNVVSFGELLEEAGRFFFTMEFIEGVDFLAYVRPQAALHDPSEAPTVTVIVQPPTPPTGR